ncbi:hypothetical protein HYV83_00960 [Candidatus Woesearchaeota archaeon]|nr:hypothetical protein [Candidatus Woesearchaeota archaeon]
MKAAKRENDIVYVNIEDPVSVRRDILEASKSLVHVLKSDSSLKELRTAKQKAVETVRTRIGEITELVNEARQLMPHMDAAHLPAEEKRPVVVKAAKPAAREGKQKPAQAAAQRAPIEHHIDKFERELQDIEKKLKSL